MTTKKKKNSTVIEITLTILVPIKKWLESVGRNFKWRDCDGPVFAASRGETLRAGRRRGKKKKPNQRWKVTTFPAWNKLCNSGTRHCITFTLHIYDHRYVPIKRWGDTNNTPQYITNKIKWPRLSSCVPLGKDIVGYFELAVTDDHRQLFINLTSQWWGGRSCGVTLLCPQAWDLRERGREQEGGWSWAHMCEKAEHVCALKRDCRTEICWGARLVGFWEFHHHLKDTKRKTWKSIMA